MSHDDYLSDEMDALIDEADMLATSNAPRPRGPAVASGLLIFVAICMILGVAVVFLL